MKIVLTGATGFIGRAALLRLAIQGHEVTALVRREGSVSDLPCQSALCNLLQADPAPLSKVLQKADAVIHLAGEPIAKARWTPETKKAIRDSRVIGTRKIVEALALLPQDERPKVLIAGSAIGFYGDRKDDVLTEESTSGQGFLSEVVRAWEEEALKAEGLGVRLVRLRTGVVLGLGGGALEKIQPVVLGSGRQWMSWIHLQDVVRFIEFALSNPSVSGAFNLTAPSPVTNGEFTRRYARATGAIGVLKAPSFVLKAVLGEMAAIVLESCKALPVKAEQAGFKFEYRTLDSALTELFPAPLEFKLSESQFVSRPLSEVFAFFSEAKNLETITPPWLNFHITRVTPKTESRSDSPMGNETLIDYRLKIHGVPVRWQSRIENWDPGKQFVDTQIKGPYAKWHHTHSFKEVRGGTLVSDQVIYRLPFGKLGTLFGLPLVKRDVQGIFAYRRKKIAEIFG